MVRRAFPFLGVHPLLLYVLRRFGYAVVDPGHPARPLFMDNCEKECAWYLGSAIMAKVGGNGRVYLQPCRTVAFLARLAPSLPIVPPHPLERDPVYTPWTLRVVMSLMIQA